MGGGARKKVRAEAEEKVLRRGAASERGAPRRFWSRRSRRGWPGDGGMGRLGIGNGEQRRKLVERRSGKDRACGRAMKRRQQAERDGSPGGARAEGWRDHSGWRESEGARQGQASPEGGPQGRGWGWGRGPEESPRTSLPLTRARPPYPPTVREPMQPMAPGSAGARPSPTRGARRGEHREPRRRPSRSAAPRLSPLGSAPPSPLHPSPRQPPSPPLPPPPPPGSPAPLGFRRPWRGLLGDWLRAAPPRPAPDRRCSQRPSPPSPRPSSCPSQPPLLGSSPIPACGLPGDADGESIITSLGLRSQVRNRGPTHSICLMDLEGCRVRRPLEKVGRR